MPPALDPPDHVLVERARDGDHAPFAVLVRRHHAAAYAVARRILRHPETAEEAAQDAFVRAWRSLASFRGEAQFTTWLYRIVARCALDHARRNARRRAEVAADLSDLPEPESTTVDDRIPLEEREVDALLAGLSDAQRAAVTLFYFGDRSVRDIAGILAVPENTVKTHLFRGRAALRRAWHAAHAHQESSV